MLERAGEERGDGDELLSAIVTGCVSRVEAIILRKIRGAVYSPWINGEKEVGEGRGGVRERKKGRGLVSLSSLLSFRLAAASYLPDWKPPALLIPNKSARRQPGTAPSPLSLSLSLHRGCS